MTAFAHTRRWREVLRPYFMRRVLQSFLHNQGLLLAGAVAFYALLSIVPLFALLLVGLSHLVDERRLLVIVASQLNLVVPGGAPSILAELESFLQHREVAGGITLVVLLFFGSLAFSVLERAMSVIFHHRRVSLRRHFLTSALIPYIYMAAIALGLLVVTLLTGALQALEAREIRFGEITISLTGASAVLIYGLGIVSEVLMLSSLYIVLPVGKVSWKHALLGGTFATLLWELTRRMMVWYFSNLSLVNLVYGSLATTIVALLTMEAASIIILLGAQFIAEYERLDAHPIR
jgi:membrane protein